MSGFTKTALSRANQLLEKGKFKEAFKIVNTIDKKYLMSPSDQLRWFLLKSTLLIKLGHFEEALTFANRAYEESQILNQPFQQIDALIAKTEALWRLARFDESLDVVRHIEQVLLTLSSNRLPKVKQRVASLLYHKGSIYLLKGDLNQALEYHQQALAIRQKVGNQQEVAASLNCLGLIYDLKADLKRALKYYQQSLGLKKKMGNKPSIAKTLANIGVIYELKGDLDQALDYYQQSLRIFKDVGSKQDIGMTFNNIGIIYMLKGVLDQALDYYRQGVALMEEIGNKQEIARLLANIGKVYELEGDLDRALGYLDQSLILHEEIGHGFYTSIPLFYLIVSNLDRGSFDEAQRYFKRLQEINNQEDNKSISQRARIAEALVLKASNHPEKHVKATELLNQVAEEEVVNQEFTVLALLNLCDLLLEEIKIANIQTIIQKTRGDFQTHVTRLVTIAHQQNSHWLMAGTWILKAKLAFVDLQHSHTMKKEKEIEYYLHQAQQLAHEKQLFGLLGRGYILLAFSFMVRNLFDEAEQELQKAWSVIEPRNLAREQQKWEETHQILQTSRKLYLDTLKFTFGKHKQIQEKKIIEDQFMTSLDDYLRRIKKFLVKPR
ncbi:MAG: DUF2225 domain-containing protein [Candidatus Hermodarchaeota archaeon]